MSDEYYRRMMAISEQLRGQKVSPSTSAPPMYRLAWKLGLRVRPPLYQSFWSLALGLGIFFGIAWGLLMWFLIWRGDGKPISEALVASLAAGVLFGLWMAAYYRWKVKRLQLPPL